MLALLFCLGCSGTTGPPWSEPEDCVELRPGRARDECRATTAPTVFRRDLGQGEAWVAGIEETLVRDYAWLTVTREVDLRGKRYCDRIETKELAERCRTLVSRPHLLQELQRGQGPRPEHGRGR